VKPRFFRSPEDLRGWLEKSHAAVAELWIGFHNQKSGRAGLTYKQALDEALCFGWIDGVRKSLDEGRYVIRFTPRTPRSIWSRVNIARMQELMAAGRVAAPGRDAFLRRDESRTNAYSFEQAKVELGPELERIFRASAAAWAFFQSQPPGYRRLTTWWVVSAKKEETRLRRLGKLIEHSAHGRPIPELDRRPAADKRRD
jgi:uncharacterized protein YdeI (YjbR/CyaY-like superfamily)